MLFMGDNADLEGSTNPILVRIREEYGNHPFDEVDETFANISGRFCEVEGREERVYVDESTEFERTYSGPFGLRYTRPRYVINRTKREYVDRLSTCVWCLRRTPSFEVVRFDPTSLLLTTWRGLDGYEDDEHGPWVGDYVIASRELPGDGYVDAMRKYVYTNQDDEIPVYATDAQIEADWRRRTEDYGDLTEEEIGAIRALLRRY